MASKNTAFNELSMCMWHSVIEDLFSMRVKFTIDLFIVGISQYLKLACFHEK